MDTLENVDWNLYEWLTPEEQADFEKWLEENSCLPEWVSDADIEEWAEAIDKYEIYERACDERRESFFDAHLEDSVMEAWEKYFQLLDLR